MSAFTDSVDHYRDGIDHVSVGACPGCADCGLDTSPCPDCDGTGYSDGLTLATGSRREDCSTCDGRGAVDEPNDDEGALQMAEEPGFSWSSCDSCGSHLGGDRHPAHGFAEGEIVHLDVCSDCLCYLANGDEPEGWE